MPSISVVIPVYNGSESIGLLLQRLRETLTTEALTYEVILVNDGSRDDSWRVISTLAHDEPNICAVNLMRNYGQHNALLCGIRLAKYETIVTMDDDLQHPPDQISKLLAALTDDFDVVYGTPENFEHEGWRNASSQITKLALETAMGVRMARNAGAFRAFRTRLREAFRDYDSPYVSIDVLLTWGTAKFTSVYVRHEPRTLGKSNYNFAKLCQHALNMVTGFSTVPLTIASLLGFATMLFGLGILIYILIRYATMGTIVPGFYFLASLICIFAGGQLLCLGILGEYIARIHVRLLSRPVYTILEQSE